MPSTQYTLYTSTDMDWHPHDDPTDPMQYGYAQKRSDTYNSRGRVERDLAQELSRISDISIVHHFFGFPIYGAAQKLHEAAVVCRRLPQRVMVADPAYPTTEFGIAELMVKGLPPTIHCENILNGMRVAHARIIPNAHLLNQYTEAGDPEAFSFGTTKFVSLEEVKKVLINTFIRPGMVGGDSGQRQPIILVGHAVENLLEHTKASFGIDLLSLGTIVKAKGSEHQSLDLLEYFKIHISNHHNAGNEAAGVLSAALLTRDDIYMHCTTQAVALNRDIQDIVEHVQALGKSLPLPSWGQLKFCTKCDRNNHVRTECRAQVQCQICEQSGVVKLFKARKTHQMANCLYQYLEMPRKDHLRQ
ncbi:hypothetical protein E8E11_000178 [Didymella keratinophila]|nr:hypothetical protein E8E11_000178 [Didymella keratinophila]